MRSNGHFDRFYFRTRLTLLHFSMPDFQTWHKKLFQRAKAYGFSMKSQCEGVRRGQRYCWSFQKLRGGESARYPTARSGPDPQNFAEMVRSTPDPRCGAQAAP